MYSFIGQKIIEKITEAAGISVRLTNNGEPVYSLLRLQKQRSKLILVQKSENIYAIKDIQASIPKGCPVFINIDGWGVLVKKSKNTATSNQENIYLGDSNEFISSYSQISNEKQSFIAVMRNDLFQQTLQPFTSAGIDLIGVNVGPFEAARLLSFLNENGEFNVGNRMIQINNGQVEDIANKQNQVIPSISLGKENVQVEMVAVYALIANFFIDRSIPSLPGNSSYLNNFLYKKLGQYVGWGILIILLTGLLINFFLFNRYNQQYNALNSEFTVQQALYEKFENVKNELIQKEELIKRVDFSNRSTFAYFADRLALTLPNPVRLQHLAFQPPERKLTTDREALFVNDKLFISGETPNSTSLHQWIDNIRLEKWVKQVDMVLYEQQKNGIPAQFKLEIVIVNGKTIK